MHGGLGAVLRGQGGDGTGSGQGRGPVVDGGDGTDGRPDDDARPGAHVVAGHRAMMPRDAQPTYSGRVTPSAAFRPVPSPQRPGQSVALTSHQAA